MEDYDNAYKDLSELKAELEGMKSKKELSAKDLAESIQKLTVAISEMLEVFGAAAAQMKIEEKEYESNIKKHEQITQKLDKIIDQNRTIAEGLVAIVEMVKEKVIEAKGVAGIPRQEPRPLFQRPQVRQERPEPRMMPPIGQQMQSMPIPLPSPNPIPGTMLAGGPRPTQPMPQMASQPGMPDFGDLPPPPTGDMNFDDLKDLDLDLDEPKKKGFFGFKK